MVPVLFDFLPAEYPLQDTSFFSVLTGRVITQAAHDVPPICVTEGYFAMMNRHMGERLFCASLVALHKQDASTYESDLAALTTQFSGRLNRAFHRMIHLQYKCSR